MTLPLTNILLIASVIFAFAFHQEQATVVMLAFAAANEVARLVTLRSLPEPAMRLPADGTTTLIPNRQRTPIGPPEDA